jgi:hypothetical protein
MIKRCDAPYKLLFSVPELVRDLVLGFIPDDSLRDLDYSTLERVPSGFVSDDMRYRTNDVLWRVRGSGEGAYLYFLIEFQSTVDRYMAVRVMTYVGLLYQDVVRARVMRPGKMLPHVLTIVLYNGKRRWSAATDVAALVPESPGLVARYQPRHAYLLIDEHRYEAADLARMKNLMACVMRLQSPENEGSMLDVMQQLSELLDGKDEVKRTVLLWMDTVISRQIGSHAERLKAGSFEEMEMSLAQCFAKWKRQYKREGLQEGRQEGEAAVLRKVLTQRFGPLPQDLQARIDAAPVDRIDVWVDRVLHADTLDEIFRD